MTTWKRPSASSSSAVAVSNPSARAAASRTSSRGEPGDEDTAAERARDLGGEQPDRPGPGDEHVVAGGDGWQGRRGSGRRRRAARRARPRARRARRGTRCRFRAGTTTVAAKAPSTNEPIERRSGQRFVRPSRHHSQTPQVEKYVSETTRAPSHSSVTPCTHLGDDARDLVPHRHGRHAAELVVDDVQVGAADARARDVEHDLPRPGRALLPLGDPDVARPARAW